MNRKIPVKLKDNEALVVADTAWIQHMIDVYRYLSTQPDWKPDSIILLEIAKNAEFWLNQTKLDLDEN